MLNNMAYKHNVHLFHEQKSHMSKTSLYFDLIVISQISTLNWTSGKD